MEEMEYWSDGVRRDAVLECWSDGLRDCWSNGVVGE